MPFLFLKSSRCFIIFNLGKMASFPFKLQQNVIIWKEKESVESIQLISSPTSAYRIAISSFRKTMLPIFLF